MGSHKQFDVDPAASQGGPAPAQGTVPPCRIAAAPQTKATLPPRPLLNPFNSEWDPALHSLPPIPTLPPIPKAPRVPVITGVRPLAPTVESLPPPGLEESPSRLTVLIGCAALVFVASAAIAFYW